MLTGITIRNFRGFKEATVDGFARVNIVVGDNGSGKSSLLEAIFLAMSNNLWAAIQLNRVRMGIADRPVTIEEIEDIGNFLSESANKFEIDTRGVGIFNRNLEVVQLQDAQMSAKNDYYQREVEILETNIPQNNWEFRWKERESNKTQQSIPSRRNPGMAAGSGEVSYIGCGYMPPYNQGQKGWAEFFSILDRTGETTAYIEAMRMQFPELEGISVLISSGTPSLHARLRGQKRLRPLEELSGGVVRLSSLLLAISYPRLSIQVVDEIENGLHHKRFPLLWKQVRDFAKRFDKQVFVTTHSQECLEAAADAMIEHPQDFTLIRTVRAEEGILIGKLPGDRAGDLMLSGFEVRG